MKPPSAKKLSDAVERWNSRYQVGQRVRLRKDDGAVIETTTRTKAGILSGHSSVIWLDGVAGCYLLDCVSAISPSGRHLPPDLPI